MTTALAMSVFPTRSLGPLGVRLPDRLMDLWEDDDNDLDIVDGGKCRKCFSPLVQCSVGAANKHPTQNCSECGSPPTGLTCPTHGQFWR